MSWYLILKKVFPLLGPLGSWLKETILGAIDHPGMEGKPRRIRVSFIIIVALAIGLYYTTSTAMGLYEENMELKFQLKLRPESYMDSRESTQRFTEETQRSFDLMICEQRLERAQRDSGSVEQLLSEERRIRRDMERELLLSQEQLRQCPEPTTPSERRESGKAETINRRLDRLRNLGGD